MSTDLPIPETRYAESDGLSIAYQCFGQGPQDLVIVPGIVSHLEANWQMPGYTPLMQQLAQSFRVIIFDKRGQGLSDRFEGVPTLEQRMDDVRAVMQAAGSQRAVLWSIGRMKPPARRPGCTRPLKRCWMSANDPSPDPGRRFTPQAHVFP